MDERYRFFGTNMTRDSPGRQPESFMPNLDSAAGLTSEDIHRRWWESLVNGEEAVGHSLSAGNHWFRQDLMANPRAVELIRLTPTAVPLKQSGYGSVTAMFGHMTPGIEGPVLPCATILAATVKRGQPGSGPKTCTGCSHCCTGLNTTPEVPPLTTRTIANRFPGVSGNGILPSEDESPVSQAGCNDSGMFQKTCRVRFCRLPVLMARTFSNHKFRAGLV